MLCLSQIANTYFIRYIQFQGGKSYVYYFDKNFLTTKIASHIADLFLFNEGYETIYSLSGDQQKAITEIIEKMIGEKDSGYIHTKYLQMTYLIELLHVILKLQQKGRRVVA
jgi:hypothetical protein